MKRIMIIMLMLVSAITWGQTVTGSRAKFRTSIELAGDKVVHFDNDSTLSANSALRLPTQKAVKWYVDNNGGGSPAGGVGDIQFNDGTSFDATSNLRYAAGLRIKGVNTDDTTSVISVLDSLGNDKLSVDGKGVLKLGNAGTATQNTAAIKSSGADADIGLALIPQGNGAITAQVPDGTTAGGNARGAYAIDLQRLRENANQVASGQYSAIVGGFKSIAQGHGSGLFCADGGSVFSARSAVLGGAANVLTGSNTAAVGGYHNNVNGYYSVGIGGYSNGIPSGGYSVTIGGEYNSIYDGYSTILGGSRNNTRATYSVTSGQRAANVLPYSYTIGSNDTEVYSGISQSGTNNITCDITGTSAKTKLQLVARYDANPKNVLSTMIIRATAFCVDKGNGSGTSGDAYCAEYRVCVKNMNGTVALVGTADKIFDKYDAGMSDFDVSFSPNSSGTWYLRGLNIIATPPSTAGSTSKYRVTYQVMFTETAGHFR